MVKNRFSLKSSSPVGESMLGISLDRKSEVSLRRQIYTALTQRMLDGRLAASEALPSTRALAEQLGVARSTVCEAYEMLIAEGFVHSRAGAATRVAPGLRLDKTAETVPSVQTGPVYRIQVNFKTGQPDLKCFPHFAFGQALNNAIHSMPLSWLGYRGPQGLPQLRAEISAWLYRSRGISADPQDIFIAAGATQALHVIGDVLYRPNGRILVEDPCHTGLLQTFLDRGYQPLPAAVDCQGMQTEHLTAGDICAIYVTPSHQFPLGGILPAGRRTALIRYAKACGCYIIEDDYDSEFRYGAEPVAPLQSMDAQRVIYVGTFSKTMFPALRVGYVVLPRPLQERWRALRKHTDVQNPPWEQAALAEWLRTRKFDRHVYRMRKHYQQRREGLLRSLNAAFGEACTPWGDAAGLHLAVAFKDMHFDASFETHCLSAGLHVVPVAAHCIQKGTHEDKLLLGYGHLEPEDIEKGVWLLKHVIDLWRSET